MLLHVSAPADKLAQHFNAEGSHEKIAQTAAIRLRAAMQQVSTQPVAVVVTAQPPKAATIHGTAGGTSKGASDVTNQSTRQNGEVVGPSSDLDLMARLHLSKPQMLWTCPLLLVALGWLWSAWRRESLAREFSAEVRRHPEQLAAVLESWIGEDASQESQLFESDEFRNDREVYRDSANSSTWPGADEDSGHVTDSQVMP